MKKKKEKKKKKEERNIDYELGQLSVEGYYDYQEIRKAQRSRVRDIIRRKIEGIPLDRPEERREDRRYDEKFKDKNLPKFLGELVLDGKITEIERRYIEKLFEISKETEKTELRYKQLMEKFLENEKFWYKWLKKIRGISSVLGSNLIKNFGYCERFIIDKESGDILASETSGDFGAAHKKFLGDPEKYICRGYEYVSSLWRHTGFDPDGAKGRRKGEKISYNPKLKTLVWKIGDSFIKHRTPIYREIYDNEKNRQLALMDNGNDNAPKSRLHADLRARRKMMKIFLQHYYLIGRKLRGLPVTQPYAFDKLGHEHFIEPPCNPFKEKDWNAGDISHKENEKHLNIASHIKNATQ